MKKTMGPLKSLLPPENTPIQEGFQETMYHGRLWTMRQYAGFGSARESNERYRLLLKKGTTGLEWWLLTFPHKWAMTPTTFMSTGEIGKVGVAISSIEDMEILLKDISLDKVSTSMTINSTAGILLAFYIAVAKRRGINKKPTSWNDSKRFTQRVHRPWNLYISSQTLFKNHHRYF